MFRQRSATRFTSIVALLQVLRISMAIQYRGILCQASPRRRSKRLTPVCLSDIIILVDCCFFCLSLRCESCVTYHSFSDVQYTKRYRTKYNIKHISCSIIILNSNCSQLNAIYFLDFYLFVIYDEISVFRYDTVS